MHSAVLAMSWQVWRRHRLGLAAVIAIVVVFVTVFQVLPAGTFSTSQGLLWTYLFVLALGYVVAVFSHGFDIALERGDSGYPRWQFTLPVRTWLLAVWPLFQATAVVSLLWAAWAAFVTRRAGVDVAVGQTALHAAALTAVLLALVWWPFGLPWARVIVAVVLVPALLVAPPFAAALGASDAVVLLGSAVTLLLGWTGAVVGVRRARRGQSGALAWPGLTWGTARSVRTFSTTAGAQLWLERKRLWPFVLVPGCAAGLFLAIMLNLPETTEEETRLSLNFLFLPVLLAPVLGLLLGRANADGRLPLSPFLGARPITSASMVAAKLRVSVEGTLIVWGTVLAAWLVWVLDAGVMPDLMQHIRGRPTLTFLVVAWLGLTTWRLLVDQFWIGLAGRTWLFKSAVGVYWLMLSVGGVLVGLYVSHEEWHADIWESLPWCLGSVLGLKLAAGAWVLSTLHQRQLVSGRAVCLAVALWLLAWAGLFLLVRQALEPMHPSTPVLLFFSALSLPLVRLAAAPLALEWNRRR